MQGLDALDGTTLLVGSLSLAVLFGLRAAAPRVPGALVVVIGGLVASSLFNLGDNGVALVGEVPRGLPSIAVPDIHVVADHALLVDLHRITGGVENADVGLVPDPRLYVGLGEARRVEHMLRGVFEQTHRPLEHGPAIHLHEPAEADVALRHDRHARTALGSHEESLAGAVGAERV